MKYFVQLKDDVVFAYHESSTEVDIPGDNIIEVESDGEKFLNKKYENGTFIDAPEIKYAVMSGNLVKSVESTVFSSKVNGRVLGAGDEDVTTGWSWNGTSFNQPGFVESVEVSVAEEFVPLEAIGPGPQNPNPDQPE
jgi:hypothetical protein